MKKYDLFISHASEDKDEIVTPLVTYLEKFGAKVWFDKHNISLGDSLRRKIDEGLSESRYAVVILSHNFFKKEWPQKELDSLVAREDGKEKVILPILHNISYEQLKNYSLLLADKLMVSTKGGIDFVAREILSVVGVESFTTNIRTVIGISGPSCSGKTWLANKIKEVRPNSVCLFSLDSYYKEAAFVKTLENRYDNPRSINFDKALEDLVLLLNGHDVEVPIYDYDSFKVIGHKVCTPAPMTIIDGLFVFSNKSILDKMDLKIWVDAVDDLRYERRINRDIKERGRDLDEVIHRYASDVQPGYQKFIQPNINYADIILPNNSRNKDNLPPLVKMIFSYVDMKNIK